MAQEMNTFLGGCRVLDLTDEKGRFCGKLLGDLGADVVQIEPPGGDPGRNRGPFYKDIPDPDKSLPWFFTGLNKRGITLNLETADGRQIFRRLAAKADFVIESFAPGYLDGLGLGYDGLEKIKPCLIMTSITPFGQKGPFAHYTATDLVGVSLAGMARLFGEMDGPPTRISAPQFYYFGSIHGAVGSMVAHYHREMTGGGQHVDVSCQQAVVLALRIAAETWDLLKVNPRGMGPGTSLSRPAPRTPVYVPIVRQCKDGHVVAMVFGGAQAGFVKSSRALVAMANREGFALGLKDFAWEKMDSSTVTQEQVDSLNGQIEPFLRSKTKAELLEMALQEEILLVPVNTVKDIAESPQLQARQYWKEVEHPELGESLVYPGWPVRWTELPAYRPQRRAPLIGEHNTEIYGKELGISAQDLVLLKAQGII